MLIKNFYIFSEIDKTAINSNFFTVFATFIFLIISMVLLFFPQITYGIPISIYSNKNIPNKIDRPIPDLKQRILNYFTQEKPYQKTSFTVDDLSLALNIPKQHIYRTFKKDLQIKFTDFKLNYKVEHAKRLLLNDSLSTVTLKEIWVNSGFSSKTAFFSTFKKNTGYTPLEFVKNNSLKT